MLKQKTFTSKAFAFFALLLLSFSLFNFFPKAPQALAASTYAWKDHDTIVETTGATYPSPATIDWKRLASGGSCPSGFSGTFAINSKPVTAVGGKYICVSNTDQSKAKTLTMAGPTGFTEGSVFSISGSSGSTSTGFGDRPFIEGIVSFPGKPVGGIPVEAYPLKDGKADKSKKIEVYPSWDDPVSYGSAYFGYTSDDGKFRTDGPLDDGQYLLQVNKSVDFCESIWGGIAKSLSGITSAFCGAAEIKEWFTGEDKLMGTAVVAFKDGVQKPSPVKLNVSIVKISPLTEAMAASVQWLAQFVSAALETGVHYINELLINTKDWVLGGNMDQTWSEIRTIAMSLLLLGLLIIAFANVLQIDIERYGLNRMIPRIILAIIMTYFSWLIVVFFFDFTQAIQQQALGMIKIHNGGLNMLGHISIVSPDVEQVIASLGMFLVTLALLIIILVSVVVLLFSLLLRVVYLSFLLVIAPLAFILMIMPFSESLYKKWWQEFWKWMFMGPMAVVIIAIGTVIAAPSGASDTTVLDPNGITATDTLIKLLILAAAVYFAGTLPKQWGGSIMAAWQNAGKKMYNNGLTKAAWGATGGRAVDRTKAFFQGRVDRRKKRDLQAVEDFRAKLAGDGSSRLRSWAAGTTGLVEGKENRRIAAARAQRQAALKTKAEQYDMANADKETLLKHVIGKDRFASEAATMEMVKRGILDWPDDDKKEFTNAAGETISGQAVDDEMRKRFFMYAADNGALQTLALKEQPGLLWDTDWVNPMSGAVQAGSEKKELILMKGDEVKALGQHAALYASLDSDSIQTEAAALQKKMEGTGQEISLEDARKRVIAEKYKAMRATNGAENDPNKLLNDQVNKAMKLNPGVGEEEVIKQLASSTQATASIVAGFNKKQIERSAINAGPLFLKNLAAGATAMTDDALQELQTQMKAKGFNLEGSKYAKAWNQVTAAIDTRNAQRKSAGKAPIGEKVVSTLEKEKIDELKAKAEQGIFDEETTAFMQSRAEAEAKQKVMKEQAEARIRREAEAPRIEPVSQGQAQAEIERTRNQRIDDISRRR